MLQLELEGGSMKMHDRTLTLTMGLRSWQLPSKLWPEQLLSEGTARLTDAVVPRVAPAWPSAGPPSAPVLAGAALCGGSVASQGDGLSGDGLFPLAAVNHGGTTAAAKRRNLSLPHMIAVSEWLVARGFAVIVSQG